jgi:hypothetical protein
MQRSGVLALVFFLSGFPGGLASLVIFALTTPNAFYRISSDISRKWLIFPTLFEFLKFPFSCGRVPSGAIVCPAWIHTQWLTNWIFMSLLTAVLGISIAAACIGREPERS